VLTKQAYRYASKLPIKAGKSAVSAMASVKINIGFVFTSD